MEFIIGGMCQGKLEYAKKQYDLAGKKIVDGEKCTFLELLEADVVYRFHLFLARELSDSSKEGNLKYFEELIDRMEEMKPEKIVISDEIGYGIVPADRRERMVREQTGRICCYLAGKAKRVVRVVCGIGTVIKE